MSRYRAHWAYDLDEDVPEPTGRTIIEDDEWQDTGLYDHHGNRLYRTDKVPMGYIVARDKC